MPPVQLMTKLKANITLKPNSRIRMLLFCIITLIALFIYYNLLYTSQARVIEALAAEYERKETLLNDYLDRDYDDIAYLKEQKKRVRSQIENQHARVPGHLDEPGVLVDIYRLVRDNNLWAEEIAFGLYQDDNGFGRLPFEITVDGYTASVYRFIGQLEDFHRLVRVAAVEFDPADSRWVSCRVNAEFYVLGEPASEPREHSFLLDQNKQEPAYSILKPAPGNSSSASGSTGAGVFAGNAGFNDTSGINGGTPAINEHNSINNYDNTSLPGSGNAITVNDNPAGNPELPFIK